MNKDLWTAPNLAWCAGLLEGEGYFGISTNTLRIACAMTDLDTIERLCCIAGFGTVRMRPSRPDRPNNKPLYEWQSRNNQDILEFELAILPWMGERRTFKIIETHMLRREYEFTAGNNIKRVFSTGSRELLSLAG